MQHKGFLRHTPSEKKMEQSKRLLQISTFRRVNLFLASCSSAGLDYASVQHYKYQMNLLYLQLVKKSNHLPHFFPIMIIEILKIGFY